MDRITIKHLEGVIARLNRETGSPATPYARLDDGRLRANIGNFHLSQQYGGVALHRMANEAGGVTTPLGMGHGTRRELYEQVHAFLRGIELGRELAVNGGEVAA